MAGPIHSLGSRSKSKLPNSADRITDQMTSSSISRPLEKAKVKETGAKSFGDTASEEDDSKNSFVT